MQSPERFVQLLMTSINVISLKQFYRTQALLAGLFQTLSWQSLTVIYTLISMCFQQYSIRIMSYIRPPPCLLAFFDTASIIKELAMAMWEWFWSCPVDELHCCRCLFMSYPFMYSSGLILDDACRQFKASASCCRRSFAVIWHSLWSGSIEAAITYTACSTTTSLSSVHHYRAYP